MSSTRGTPLLGSRAAHNTDYPDLHGKDLEDDALKVHLDPDATADDVMIMGDAGLWEARPPAIPLLDTDPTSPEDGEVWVRRTVTATGTPIGLLLALTTTLYTRELSIYDGGAVYRTTLTVGV